MKFTAHGHPIPGTEGTWNGRNPDSVARCGGVSLCNRCKLEAHVTTGGTFDNSYPVRIEARPKQYLAKRFGPSYVDAAACYEWIKNFIPDTWVDKELSIMRLNKSNPEISIPVPEGHWIVLKPSGKLDVHSPNTFVDLYEVLG